MPPIPKPKRRPSKRHRERAKRRVVNPLVDARDGLVCRCCGIGCAVMLDPTHPRSWHRHHIQYRSACGAESTANKLGLCGRCHRAIHDKKLRIVGTDANGPLQFIEASTALRESSDVFGLTAVSDRTQGAA